MSRYRNPVYPEADVVFDVVNGHRHNGVDSRLINHTSLQNIGVNTHAQIDTRLNRRIYQLSVTGGSANGNGSDSVIVIGTVVYAQWRVLSVGVIIGAAGNSGTAEKITFNLNVSDLGATQESYYGNVTQDVGAGKQWAAGDTLMNPLNITDFVNPDPPDNGGVHTWVNGAGMNIWNTKSARLTATKKNVLNSTATIYGAFAIIEAVITQ